jgi:hypothetical protein
MHIVDCADVCRVCYRIIWSTVLLSPRASVDTNSIGISLQICIMEIALVSALGYLENQLLNLSRAR